MTGNGLIRNREIQINRTTDTQNNHRSVNQKKALNKQREALNP